MLRRIPKYPDLRARKPRHQCHCKTEKKHKGTDSSLSAGLQVLLEGTHELLLLGRGLEGTVAELGRSIDPLELDLFEGLARGVGEKRLAESHDPLLNTRDRTLDHDVVVVDLAVANEATHAVGRQYVLASLEGEMRTYGVIFFLVRSVSVEALASSSPLPMR